MKWLLPGVSALVCGAMGLLLAGWIASLCVKWYHISSFEGGSGYYVLFLALGGGIAGFAIGAITCLMVMLNQGSFGKGLLLSAGIVAGAGAIALCLAWLMGDIPPTIDGDQLQLVVELRCPPAWKPPLKAGSPSNWMDLQALNAANTVRRTERGYFQWDKARQENGTRIVSASMHVFHSRGRWALDVTMGEQRVVGFLLPLTGKPKREDMNWSDWLPRTDDPKVADGFRYRYRVMKDSEWRAAKDAQTEKILKANREQFAALPEDAPLVKLLPYLHNPDEYEYLVPEDVQQDAMDRIRQRPEELADLASDPNPEISGRALYALLTIHPLTLSPAALAKVQASADRIASDLTSLKARWNPDDPDTKAMLEIQNRLLRWFDLWERLHMEKEVAVPAPPALNEILRVLKPWTGNDTATSMASTTEDHLKRWAEAAQTKQ